MSSRDRSMTWGGAALVALVIVGPGLFRVVEGESAGPDSSNARGTGTTHYEIGRAIFFRETFGGNGRTCATCHDPTNEFTVSPARVQERQALDPGDPLFRALDSDDGQGVDYTTVLSRAVFRVTVPLHPDVTLVDDPGARTITVRRGVPAIANVALTAPYLLDGRESTLEGQAQGAILDHMQPARQASLRELSSLAAFERELFYPLRLRVLADPAGPAPLPAGFSVPASSPATRHGRDVFDQHCRQCHDGETRSVLQGGGAPFADVSVSQRNLPGFPLLALAFRQPDGSTQVVLTPDPGRAALTGRLADLNTFNIPSLRGVKHTAPYFHDNSANTLWEVVTHYNTVFQFQMTEAEVDDLVAFLELL